MTEREKMDSGAIYNPADASIMREQIFAVHKLKRYNKISPANFPLMSLRGKRMFGEIGKNSFIIPPFYANWGGKHVFWGKNCYANFNLTLVDDANIYVGDNVMIGPNVTLCTAGHPVLPELRLQGLQYNADIHIEKNVWIGTGAIILAGVTVGENSVIGAGSVVTRDIPKNVVAVGSPCKVMREINERDKEFYFKDKRI